MAKHDQAQCGRFEAAMQVLAKPWTGLIIMMLEGGPLRFRELGDRVGSIGDRMLALRLKELEARHLVERRVMPGPPVRVEYALTVVGRGFREVAEAVQRWGGSILEAETQAEAQAEVQVEPKRRSRARAQ